MTNIYGATLILIGTLFVIKRESLSDYLAGQYEWFWGKPIPASKKYRILCHLSGGLLLILTGILLLLRIIHVQGEI